MGSPYYQNVTLPESDESLVIYRQKERYEPYNSNQYYGYTDDPADHIALLSLILGILSFLPQTFYCGILAIIFAVMYRKKGNGMNRGKTVAALICGITGTMIGLLAIVFLIANWDRVKVLYDEMYN